MTLQRFVDKTRRWQRRADCQLNELPSARRSFCRAPVACKDDAVDEVRVQLTVIGFFQPTDDMDGSSSKTDSKARLCFPCWPYQRATIFWAC